MLRQLGLLALAGLSAAQIVGTDNVDGNGNIIPSGGVAGGANVVPNTPGVGSAIVVNNCDWAVTLWSVGGQISDPHTLARNGGKYSEQYHRDPKTGGIAIKITVTGNGLYTGAAQTIFAYTLDGSNVWYDMSSSMGDPFAGKRLTVTPSNRQCQAIIWPEGRTPAGSQVKTCTSNSDTTLTLCAPATK